MKPDDVELREPRDRPRPPVLALMPHFGEPQDSLDAVETLRRCGYPDLRIVVVDNSDNLPDAGYAEGVEILRPRTNVGYCAAVNLGLARARELGIELFLLVNNDTVTEPSAIESLVDALLGDETVAGVGPLLTTERGKRIWSAGAYLRFGPNEVIQRAIGKTIDAAPRFPSVVDFLPGAFALYRTSDLLAVGGIDEVYFMYLEDVDLGVRLKERGRRLLYVPWVEVVHGGSLSSGGGTTPLRKFFNGCNTPRLLRRCSSFKLWMSFILFDIVGLVPSIVVHLGNRRRMRAQLAKGRGIFKGIFGYVPSAKDVDYYKRKDPTFRAGLDARAPHKDASQA
ncbi:MAG: glycosyltransferase family 2 protein [Planctomycetes bacterium]|nr:glycosyltransferase family 2 protein [Planctomycetota bacterium]